MKFADLAMAVCGVLIGGGIAMKIARVLDVSMLMGAVCLASWSYFGYKLTHYHGPYFIPAVILTILSPFLIMPLLSLLSKALVWALKGWTQSK
ncbi:hypothetical protein ABT56_16105 [Photobacterium aquae]|uniref:Uncharacterized protein n=2 Tax=Photobacterium aquae TaxID=1195763 RepID=A0A0J1GXF5_9GAMM|nr:hypothetical protein ABT56_16105 [Photobacterium aquae]